MSPTGRRDALDSYAQAQAWRNAAVTRNREPDEVRAAVSDDPWLKAAVAGLGGLAFALGGAALGYWMQL